MSAEALVRTLTELAHRDDRAALARLRRALNPTGIVGAYRYLHESVEQGDKLEGVALLAALFGHNPLHDHSNRTSIGSACAMLAKGESTDAAERRFNRLLSADRDGLAVDLLGVAKRADQKGIHIDYELLAVHIRNWANSDRHVQLAWARDFYRQASTTHQKTNTSTTEENQ